MPESSHARHSRKDPRPVTSSQSIEQAKTHFGTLLEGQLARIEAMKREGDWTDFSTLKPIIIGVVGGDGIGPAISAEAQRVLETLLADQIAAGQIEFRTIEGLTIENRAAKNAATNPSSSTSRPASPPIHTANASMAAFTTSMNRPSVMQVTGRLKNCATGVMSAFTSAKMAAVAMSDCQP